MPKTESLTDEIRRNVKAITNPVSPPEKRFELWLAWSATRESLDDLFMKTVRWHGADDYVIMISPAFFENCLIIPFWALDPRITISVSPTLETGPKEWFRIVRDKDGVTLAICYREIEADA